SPPLPGSAKSTVLQGGVKDDAALQSTVHLTPLSTDRTRLTAPISKNGAKPFPEDAQLDQYSGSNHLTPGNASTGTTSSQATIVRSGVIPPISTYTLTPHTGVLWTAPGFEVTPPSMQVESTYHPSSSTTDPAPITHKGVTSYIPGYEVNTIS